MYAFKCITIHLIMKDLLPNLTKVPSEFSVFLAMHQEIGDAQVHTQLHNDLVKHLWEKRGNTT
jgi:hypothetical protein